MLYNWLKDEHVSNKRVEHDVLGKNILMPPKRTKGT
jgi:hypothetical protein